MKLTPEQMQWLLNKMVEAARAVQEDHEYRHSDYGGMKVYRFTSNPEQVAEEFNQLEA